MVDVTAIIKNHLGGKNILFLGFLRSSVLEPL